MSKQISTPIMVAIVVIVLAVAGALLFKGATGGTQGDGKVGHVEAAPPIPGGGAPPGARGSGR